MIWPYLFAGLIVLVVVLKYLKVGGNRCPQCSVVRDEEMPLCRECGWIFDDDDDDDEEDSQALEYGDADAPEPQDSPWDR